MKIKQGIVNQLSVRVRRAGVCVNKVRYVEDVADNHCCDIPCVVIKLGPN